MHVISRKRLKEFSAVHGRAEKPLDDWYKKIDKIKPENIAELRDTFPHADLVGKCYVFNVGGNKYRIITKIYFREQTVLVRYVLTHDEYDDENWKNDCC